MSTSLRIAALAAAVVLALPASLFAASLTYRGTLQDRGQPANGSYDLQLTLYSAATGGKAIGSPITLHDVPVRDGAFSTEVDFGAAANGVGTAWVAAAIAPAGSGQFSALDARSVASLDAPEATCDGSWVLSGNSGNPSGSFLGTTDNNPLKIMVDGQQAGYLAASSIANQPNIVFGGANNTVTSGIANAVISGGSSNTVSGAGGDVAGGSGNTASGVNSFVAGWNNTASGFAASIPGGEANSATGRSSFAAGFHAHALHDGSFVWSDFTASGSPDFSSTSANQFLIHAAGGVGIGTNNPSGSDLTVNGTKGIFFLGAVTNYPELKVTNMSSSTGAGNNTGGSAITAANWSSAAPTISTTNSLGGTALYVESDSPASGTHIIDTSVGAYLGTDKQWHNGSDRNSKTGFQSVDVGRILERVVAMPVTSWHFKTESDAVRHIGPMAQDFFSMFKLGTDDKTIGNTDESGVTIAAIQGLNQKLEGVNQQLQQKNAALEAELHALSARVEVLTDGAK